jgi:uncharacterized membrane protein
MDLVRELLDLVVRWVHVVAGIMWIGNSLLFNWLDRNLGEARQPRATSRGEIWLLHSGGFYHVEKMLSPGAALPRPLHWFKWQAYTTWLSGAALLVLVYFMSGAALLFDATAGLTPNTARLLAVGVLAIGWLLYEVLWRSPLGNRTLAAGLVSFVLLIGSSYVLSLVLTGRATLLLMGSLMGTLMAGNVFLHIMPSQRGMVAAVAGGAIPDARLSDRAKLRSIHNNYLTFPVIVLMLSSHFPSFYGQDREWLVIGVLLLAGAGVRHVLNIRFTRTDWRILLGATVVASISALFMVGSRRERVLMRGEEVSFGEVEAVIYKRCSVCHSVSPADRSFGASPGGVAFDAPEDIRALAARILVRAVETRTMPPANKTNLTDAERELLGRWAR